MELPDPRESEGRRQVRLLQTLPLLPLLPHQILPPLHLLNVVRHAVIPNWTGQTHPLLARARPTGFYRQALPSIRHQQKAQERR
jgi:hypothetical protein